MNLKKNVFKEICIFIIILLILSTSVMANNDQQVSDVKQKYEGCSEKIDIKDIPKIVYVINQFNSLQGRRV